MAGRSSRQLSNAPEGHFLRTPPECHPHAHALYAHDTPARRRDSAQRRHGPHTRTALRCSVIPVTPSIVHRPWSGVSRPCSTARTPTSESHFRLPSAPGSPPLYVSPSRSLARPFLTNPRAPAPRAASTGSTPEGPVDATPLASPPIAFGRDTPRAVRGKNWIAPPRKSTGYASKGVRCLSFFRGHPSFPLTVTSGAPDTPP
jgi:hypothetical protein